MTWLGLTCADWIFVVLLALSVLGGFRQGFFRAVFSLGGLLVGLVLAEWNYARVARLLLPVVRFDAVADVVGFLLIAVLVMCIAGIIGAVLAKVLHSIGLGCVDRLAGAAFGFLQGALLVMLCILVTVAFFPRAHWLAEARLPRYFFGACHLSARMSPAELAERLRSGLRMLEDESPKWMHPSGSS